MRAKKIIALLLIAAVIFAMCYVCLFDVTIGDYRFPDALDSEYGIKQGLDLVGGSLIEFTPEAGVEPTADQMVTVNSIMRSRLDSQGYYDAVVTVQADNTVRIEIPNVDDPNEAVTILGTTAKLTFRDYQNTVLMEGSDVYVKDAQMSYGQTSEISQAEYFVTLSLTDEGQKVFKSATETVLGYDSGNNYIAIYLDETEVSRPMVSTIIDDTSCVITGSFTEESASTLASQIRSGQLPFKLETSQLQSVGPTLGEAALSKSLIAAGIGILLVIIFMIALYRLAGFTAAISLCAYTSLVVIILIRIGATLTLSGIAGLVLSIGMAVDADCIIFERLKEELRTGKTLGASLDAAFNRAMVAIFDANITTLICAGVLYFLGTGSIKGFAVTLGVGTIVSFFTAIVLTKVILKLMIGGFGIKKSGWFGVKGGAANE